MPPILLWRRELHGQRKGVTESSLFYIILNSQLREELKKENRWRKCCTISITTNLAAAKQGYATHKLSHLAYSRQASGKRIRREASVGNARLNVLMTNNDILSEQLLRFINLNTYKTLGSYRRKLSELSTPHDSWWEDTIGKLLRVQCCFCDTIIFCWDNYNWVKIRQCIRHSTHSDVKEQGCS